MIKRSIILLAVCLTMVVCMGARKGVSKPAVIKQEVVTPSDANHLTRAYSWGDHALFGYLTHEHDPNFTEWLLTFDNNEQDPNSVHLTGNQTITGVKSGTFDINTTGDANIAKIETSHPAGYGCMYMYDNVTTCVIDTVNVYHAVYNTFGNNDACLAPIIDTNYFTFKAGIGYTITAEANYIAVAGTTQFTTSATHALLTGEPVTITGTTNYNGAYLVGGVINGTNFYVTKTYIANDAAGSVRRPATLKCLKSGVYKGGFNVSGTAETTNDVFKWELSKDITPLDNISVRSIWTSGVNYRSGGSSGLLTLTSGQYVWLSVKNYSGVGDLTINSANVYISREL